MAGMMHDDDMSDISKSLSKTVLHTFVRTNNAQVNSTSFSLATSMI
jgi:hypothetical protein